jgi:hypothetical protein
MRQAHPVEVSEELRLARSAFDQPDEAPAQVPARVAAFLGEAANRHL